MSRGWLRDSRWDDPTIDVVERERRLLAETRAVTENRQVVRTEWTPLRVFSTLLCVTLVAVYLVIWASSVQTSGGPEGYVRGTSFVSVLTGAAVLRQGSGALLYDDATQRSAQSALLSPSGPLPPFLPFDHLPFEALLMAPLLTLPVWFAFALWTMVTGLSIGLAVGFLDGALPVSRPVGWVLSLGACSFLPVIRGLMIGQDISFVLLGLCGLYAALKRGYLGWAAVALLLVSLRPSVLPFILIVLLLQGYIRVLALYAALVVGLIVVTMPALGLGWPLSYLAFLGSTAPGVSGAQIGSVAHSWFALASGLFGGSASGLVVPLFFLLLLASGAAFVWVWLRGHAVAPNDTYVPTAPDYEPHFDLMWALAGVLAVLGSLHPSPDDLALLVFPAWILGAYATLHIWPTGQSRLWVAILGAGYLLAPLAAYFNPGSTGLGSIYALYIPLLTVCAVLLALRLSAPPPQARGLEHINTA